MCVTARLHGNEAEAPWAKTLLPVRGEGIAARSEINTSVAAVAAAAAAVVAASWDTMLSLQDSVFFEISIKSLLKSWSSSCKYICLHRGNAEV